jgi:hypothetical protein
MKTEDWEEIFREKINDQDTPPPQTRWNKARSWEQLKAQIPTAKITQPEADRPLWLYYAAASVALLLLFTFAFTVYIRQQEQEISQLNAALLQAKTRNSAMLFAAKNDKANHTSTKSNSQSVPIDTQKPPLPLKQAKHHFLVKEYPTLLRKDFTQPIESTKEITIETNQSDRPIALPSIDTKQKNALPSNEVALKAFLTQAAGNSNRTETSVTLTFPGKEAVLEENTLAEETSKLRKKRLFRMLANGRNTDTTPEKPAEWIGVLPFMSAKTNK